MTQWQGTGLHPRGHGFDPQCVMWCTRKVGGMDVWAGHPHAAGICFGNMWTAHPLLLGAYEPCVDWQPTLASVNVVCVDLAPTCNRND